MYFIGREGSRIYLMWNPETQKEVRTTSVTFASAPLLDASIERATALHLLPEPDPTLLPPQIIGEDLTEADGAGPASPLSDDDFSLPEQGLGHHFDGLCVDDNTKLSNSTPPTVPEAPRYTEISAGLEPRLILDSDTKRTRKPTAKKACSDQQAACKTTLATAIALYNYELPVRVARAFASAMLAGPTTYNSNTLPPEPTNGKQGKSTSGYLFKFVGGTICHKSSKQRLVTTSTTEAEYVGLTFCSKEATWLVRLLRQLNYLGADITPLKLLGDNQPSIQLVSSEGYHERTKHVDIYYHYIKDQVKDGKIDLQYVPTAKMAADGLTKPLDKLKHAAWVAQVGLRLPLIRD
jgi:hypothetical protein